jgi:hypothetical protein
MSTADSERRREQIQNKLMQCAGSAGGANAVAAAMLATWSNIAVRLSPVIGERGVAALCSRALHISSRSLPWLSAASERAQGTAPLEAISKLLQQQEAAVAAAASCEFLSVFTEVLADLIGEHLTDRLLGPVWAPPVPAPERERRS